MFSLPLLFTCVIFNGTFKQINSLVSSQALKNWCFQTVVLEKTWASLGLQGDQTSQSERKLVLNIHWKDWCWSWSSNTLAIWCEELTHWKRPWCWERLRAEEEGDREWDGWMASLTQWTWAWATPRDGEGQGNRACCSPWGHTELDTTEHQHKRTFEIELSWKLQDS